MSNPAILIVDDEKNIRLTLASALETHRVPVDTASTGEEALQKLTEKSFNLMLLDLKLPGMDGLEVLRRVTDKYPDLKVVIMTAYGSIEVAVEAMKTGAIDFLQKPLDPNMVHKVVSRVLKGPPEGQPAWKYEYYIDMAKQHIAAGEFDVARVYANQAIFLEYHRPEAHNILGGVCEANGDNREAAKNYRVALEMDPTYEPARKNLDRVTSRPYTQLGIDWGYQTDRNS
jgi:FixJ family two-component response regulator